MLEIEGWVFCAFVETVNSGGKKKKTTLTSAQGARGDRLRV